MAKAAKKILEAEVSFETYVDEVIEIAERVMREHGAKRDRAAIRQAVEKYVGTSGMCGKATLNRRQGVERGLANGVTKLLEAWDYVAANKAWPPGEG